MGGAVVGGVLRKRPELRSPAEVALVHQLLHPLAFYRGLHPDPAACGPPQAFLCRHALLRELHENEILHEEGSPAAGFSLILSGALSEYQRQYSGQTGAGRYLRKLGPGKGFGEEALTQPTTRLHSSTLVAAEGTELLLLRREDYCAMLAMAAQALHVRPALRSDDDLLCLYSLASSVLFFRPVRPPALLQLARTLEPAAASPGQVIVAQGHLGTALYVILAGTVAVHRSTAEAPGERIGSEEAGATEVGPQVGTPLQAGDAFGEEALLQAEGRHAASFVAVEAAQLVTVPRAAFDRLLRGLGSRLPFQPEQVRRTLAQPPRRRTSTAVQGLAHRLHGLTFFKAFSADCVRHLAAACTYSRLYAGDRVFEQGSVSSAFFVLLSGSCSIYVREQDPTAAAEASRPADLVPTPQGRSRHASLIGPPPHFPGSGPDVPLLSTIDGPARRGTRTTGGGEADVPDMQAITHACPPPFVPLTVSLLGAGERGPRRGGARFATSNTELSSPRSPSPTSRRSRFATEASGVNVAPAPFPTEPLVLSILTPRTDAVACGPSNRAVLDPTLKASDGPSSGRPASPTAPLLPPALDDLTALPPDKPRRRPLATPFVPPPWPDELPPPRSPGAASGGRLSPKVKSPRGAPTSAPRPPSAGGKSSPRGGSRGLSDEDFEKLVSSFRGGAGAGPDPSQGKEADASAGKARKRQGSNTGSERFDAETRTPAVAGSGCSRPWKGFLLSGGDADVDPTGDARKRWGRLVRTCQEGDAFGEKELGQPDTPLRAATVVATEATELLVIAVEDYRRHLQDAHVRQLAAHTSFLSCIPLFRELSPAVLASVVYRLRPREVTAKGAVILEQGKPADGLYLVHTGDVIMSANAAGESSGPLSGCRSGLGGRVDLSVLGPGAVFGEACVSGAASDYNVAAVSGRVALLVLHLGDVRALGAAFVAAVEQLRRGKAAFREQHQGRARLPQPRPGDEGRQLPAWLQALPPHLLATPPEPGPQDKLARPLVSPRLNPIPGEGKAPPATFSSAAPSAPQISRQTPRLELEIPPQSEPLLSSGLSPRVGSPGGLSPSAKQAGQPGSPSRVRPLLTSLSWPRSSPPVSPGRSSPGDASLEAHMAQVMGASWGLRTSA